MSVAINFTKRDENLYNNLIKEIRKYRKGTVEETAGEKNIYLEEFQYVRNLNLNFTSITSIIIDDKPLISYFTNLKAIHIKAPYRPTGDELDSIPNKDLIKEIEIENTDLQTIDLSGFTNLEYLTIIDNKNLKEIKGLNKINKLSSLVFYNNPLLITNDIYKFICSNMKNNCSMNIDILYYLIIRHNIRKEYSLYRDSFRATEWIETVDNNDKKTTINHNTRSTGMFYAKINDLLDEIMPSSDLDDLETVYIIYKWLVLRLSGPKEEKVKITKATNGHLNGAFNAIYNKETTCSGYINLFQMMLKACMIESYSIPAYYDIEIPTNATSELKPNHTIIKIVLEDGPYYCDLLNKAIYSQDGDFTQNCFMKTPKELDSSWCPKIVDDSKSVEITKEERKALEQLEIANHEPKDYSSKIDKLMDKFDLHIDEANKTLSVEISVKKEQVEDLMLLGIINGEIEKEIDNKIEKEYYDLLADKK